MELLGRGGNGGGWTAIRRERGDTLYTELNDITEKGQEWTITQQRKL